jgi:flagellar biosynthesis protein
VKKAVAIHYQDEKDRAPSVTASGRGLVAERIIALARQNGVPLYEDRDLAQVLAALDIDAEIPPELYRAVAEVLAYIYRLNGNRHAT